MPSKVKLVHMSVRGRKCVLSVDPWAATVCALLALDDPRVDEVLVTMGAGLMDAVTDEIVWPNGDDLKRLMEGGDEIHGS